ncbi:hypothetical protein ACFUTX_11770 [Microbacterium sp. NPDC057407]|uniref:hypothetical protein n=1 Tax=Microbacterium sp. NPDC057407 TaxID=3346120 RepID=UPI0036710DBB
MEPQRHAELMRMIEQLEREREDAILNAMLSSTIAGGWFNERARELTAQIDEARRQLQGGSGS